MSAVKIRKSTFKHVEDELKAYHDTRKEIIRLRNEILYSGPTRDDNTGGGRSNIPGNPTERKGTALTINRKLNHYETIIEAVEAVYNRLPAEKQKLIIMAYWTHPQILTWEGIAQKLHVGRMTAFRWRDEIIYAIAETLGWQR